MFYTKQPYLQSIRTTAIMQLFYERVFKEWYWWNGVGGR